MAMASSASLATLGSVRPTPCLTSSTTRWNGESTSSSTLLAAVTASNHWTRRRTTRRRRLHVALSSIGFVNYATAYTYYGWKTPQRFLPSTPCPPPSRRRICKCVLSTNVIEEETEISSSLEQPTFSKDNNNHHDADLILKPAPKPVLNLRPNGPVRQVVSDKRSRSTATPAAASSAMVDDRDELLIESLEEVLDKAEKLETSIPGKLGSRKESKDAFKQNASTNPGRFVNATAPLAMRKSKTLKSVWRKGNPVANVKRVLKELPKNVEKPKSEEQKVPSMVAGPKQLDSPSVAPLRLQMPSPSRPTPRLQAKPAVAPPPAPPQSVAKKHSVVKDRKPILIDEFAVKKPIVDPIAEAVLAPTKLVRSPLPSKGKDERRKKSSAARGLRKRLVDDAGIPDDTELDMPIPGVAGAGKGRKWSKASRKAARLQAAKAAEPVQVEILEVGEEGMLTEELAYNLAVSEADILGYLFSKGVRPDAVQTFDKDMVKMICKEYGVEVIEAEPVKMEEMAKKKRSV